MSKSLILLETVTLTNELPLVTINLPQNDNKVFIVEDVNTAGSSGIFMFRGYSDDYRQVIHVVSKPSQTKEQILAVYTRKQYEKHGTVQLKYTIVPHFVSGHKTERSFDSDGNEIESKTTDLYTPAETFTREYAVYVYNT